MNMTWAKLSELKAGDIVRLDGGFTCAKAGPALILEDADGLYFECVAGKHYLDGQLLEDDDSLIGVTSTE
jgi:hypothetical protein